MMLTKISRRSFLATITLLPWLSIKVDLARASNPFIKVKDYFLNGHHNQAGKFYVSGFNAIGSEQFRMPLPEMPHGFAIDPSKNSRLVIFPGLLGTKAIIMDIIGTKQLAEIKIRSGRCFNGHGVFSPDGKLLFATENILETSEGVIGVYDAITFAFLRELPGHGLGPHGIRMLPDGKTLVVASGGLRTYPETGKYYLDLNNMHSALLFIDAQKGSLLARREIAVHRLSIRNMYFAADNTILVTCQYKGKREIPKLVGIMQGMGEIEMLEIDDDNLWSMQNYTGGSAVVGDVFAVSCPRGNLLTLWDLKSKKFIKSVKIKDVSGVQPCDQGRNFIASANTGELYKIDAKSLKATRLDEVWENAKWTNHMVKTTV